MTKGVLEAVKDDLYRLTGETLSGSTAYSKVFGYDPVGNRQTQTTTGSAGVIVTPGTINYGYDTRDRLLTENATTYGYDANGNLTTQSGFGTYTFDTENRLVRIAKSDGTLIEHAYDADGTRIRTKTTPPAAATQTTNFLVDTSGGLSHVVAEFDAAGIQTNYYLRALDDLLAVIRPTATPGVFTTRQYHADGIGSIRKLTDETGAVTDSYEYTAFGEQYEHIGTDPQPYSFAGEPLDPNTGFQYHRARWMQPSTGRFVGIDPRSGAPGDPVSLHRYLYGNGDPARFTDPTGEISLAAGLTVGAMVGTLAGISIFKWSPYRQGFAGGTMIRARTQAVTIGPSAWTGGEIAAMVSQASMIWEREAGISFSAGPATATADLPSETVTTIASVILYNLKYGNPPPQLERDLIRRLDAFLDVLPRGPHVTAFIASTGGGADAVAFLNDLPKSRHLGRGFAFIGQGSSPRTLAHEWGHTLGLKHGFALPFLGQIPVPFSLMRYGGTGLSADEQRIARSNAARFN